MKKQKVQELHQTEGKKITTEISLKDYGVKDDDCCLDDVLEYILLGIDTDGPLYGIKII